MNASHRKIVTMSQNSPHTIISNDKKKMKGPIIWYKGMKLITVKSIMEASVWDPRASKRPRNFNTEFP
jgi:hypothetical protein